MRLRINWLLVALVLVIACTYNWTALGQRQSSTSTQWEYTVKHQQSVGLAPNIFNELGTQGWELVSIAPDGWAYFKRPKK
jgi:hypothetical protein